MLYMLQDMLSVSQKLNSALVGDSCSHEQQTRTGAWLCSNQTSVETRVKGSHFQVISRVRTSLLILQPLLWSLTSFCVSAKLTPYLAKMIHVLWMSLKTPATQHRTVPTPPRASGRGQKRSSNHPNSAAESSNPAAGCPDPEARSPSPAAGPLSCSCVPSTVAVVLLQRAAQICFQLRTSLQTPPEVGLSSYTAITREKIKNGTKPSC